MSSFGLEDDNDFKQQSQSSDCFVTWGNLFSEVILNESPRTACQSSLLLSWFWSLSHHSLFYVLQATFYALRSSYRFLTPNLWKENVFTKGPFAQFSEFLATPEAASKQ